MQLDISTVDRPQGEDGLVAPEAPEAPATASGWRFAVQQVITAVIVFGPLVAFCVIVPGLFGEGLSLPILLLAAAFYFVIGHGVTIGFHRLFTHRSFEARRPLKITLAVLGSMSFQGSIIGWVADHRRHHMYSDKPGDPHSPKWNGSHALSKLGGLWHSHVGWFFRHEPVSRQQFAPDLLADRDLVVIDRLFVPFCIATLALPFAIGYALTGRVAVGLAAFLWAGVLRVGLLHQITWSTNSICHTFGKRPFRTTDGSTNFAPLAVLSMGEAWHNGHHAFPASARHGVDRGQVDSSAFLIRAFEHLGWASRVRWPDADRLASRRINGQGRDGGSISG
jgi:stearoyl-CoA desaturase (Delta-9 desaturase)